MNKIRIGNDIKLYVKLLGENQIDPININSVKVYIINTTLENKIHEDIRNKTKFISRFPVEPVRGYYQPNEYNLNVAGFPSYHAMPYDHMPTRYNGFGLNPQWNNIYKPEQDYNAVEFLAPVKHTDDPSILEVVFPAEAQLYCGKYKIVVVAKLYESGYSYDNTRTVTMDEGEVFELVSSSEIGRDNDIEMNVGFDPQSNE